MSKRFLGLFLSIVAWSILIIWFSLDNSALAQTTNSLNVATYNVESPRICGNESPSETIPGVVAQDIKKLADSDSPPDLWALSEVPNRDAAETYVCAQKRFRERSGALYSYLTKRCG